eukprot:NODE_48_length_31852_cov_1.054168.p14 type:complete len:288 gc:universal NODE_48_length_31852_cov_1.054168:10897-11760(+)
MQNQNGLIAIKHPQRSKTMSISKPNYVKVKVLGIGAFAKVELVSKDGQQFALKSGEVQNEYNILKNIHHPNIVKCEQYIPLGNSAGLLLEYVKGGELFCLIAFHFNLMKIEWINRIMTDLCDAVYYLHDNGIAHRDIKLENILLYSKVDVDSNPPVFPFSIKLCDFGLATSEESSTKNCGSKEYAAPELILQQEYDPKQTDMWSIGVVWYACCCGQLPFGDQNTLAKQFTGKKKKIEFLITGISYRFTESNILNETMKIGIQHLICHRDKRWNINSLKLFLSENKIL